jgi:hypothetical protein
MEEPTNTGQLEMLAKIHNQLIDLKKIIVEIELAKPGITQSLQTQLRGMIASDQPVSASNPGAVVERQQKVITPIDTNIQPGEGA